MGWEAGSEEIQEATILPTKVGAHGKICEAANSVKSTAFHKTATSKLHNIPRSIAFISTFQISQDYLFLANSNPESYRKEYSEKYSYLP